MNFREVSLPRVVESQQQLSKLAHILAAEPRIAVDTESNSLFAYQERVCLLQFSTPAADYLVDPLALSDLSPLAPIFANPAIEKIFHAAEYDVICLKRDYHFELCNLFDTMLAARILGLPEVGLGPLLNARFGVEVDKHFQRANWGVRPLSREMQIYAACDTHYLFALRDSLEIELQEKELLALAQEDFRFVSRTEGHGVNGSNTNCWKVAGATHLTPRQAAILDRLLFYRDEWARKVDLPHFKVLGNQLLISICISEIHSLEELEKAEGMSHRVFQRHGQGLYDAYRQGQAAPPIPRPPRPRLDADYLLRIEHLKTWRKNTASEMKVESDIVLPRELMEVIAHHHPRTAEEIDGLMKEYPYRRSKYGTKLLAILNQEEVS